VATTKIEKTVIERAGVGFGIGRQGEAMVVEVRPHNDTISALRGVQIGFELLSGITLEQAKKIVDVLNENVIDVSATTASVQWTDDRAEAASA